MSIVGNDSEEKLISSAKSHHNSNLAGDANASSHDIVVAVAGGGSIPPEDRLPEENLENKVTEALADKAKGIYVMSTESVQSALHTESVRLSGFVGWFRSLDINRISFTVAQSSFVSTGKSFASSPFSAENRDVDDETMRNQIADEASYSHLFDHHPVLERPRRTTDKMLDYVVAFSGSPWAFWFVQLLNFAWAFSSIKCYGQNWWQISIGNVQAIYSYIWDSLLMRMLLLDLDRDRRIYGQLYSRNISKSRMLQKVMTTINDGSSKTQDVEMSSEQVENLVNAALAHYGVDFHLPNPTLWQRICLWGSFFIGHIFSLILYWITFFIWLAFGPSNGWSDNWQLYYNSGLSSWMIITFAFLAVANESAAQFQCICIQSIHRIDLAIEHQLRLLTHDEEPNPCVSIVLPQVNPLQHCINYYANVIGTLVGILLLIIAMITWVAVGPIPVLDWSSNWWLIIGTYAGLLGLNDGFVLRNVQMVLANMQQPWKDQVREDDFALLDIAGEPRPDVSHLQKYAWHWQLTQKLSDWTLNICAHSVAVLFGVLLVIALVIGASVMKWSETGQLLCNIPPMVIESFLMQILITGEYEQQQKDLTSRELSYRSRLALFRRLATRLEGEWKTSVLLQPADVPEPEGEAQ